MSSQTYSSMDGLHGASCPGLPLDPVKPKIKRETEVTGTRTCPQCGSTVEPLTGRREKKFCSDACRMTWWNSHSELVQRKAYYALVCQYCGKPFTSYGNRNRRYCSRSCYLEAKKRPDTGQK